MNISRDDIHQVVNNVWTNVLGLELEPSEPVTPPEGNEGLLTGCVQITGTCERVVTLACAVAAARRAASIMFDKPEEAITSDLLHDTVGEFSNMAAGSLKALLPGPCYLSLPVVIDGSDYTLRVRDTTLLTQHPFRSEGGLVLVSVYGCSR